MISLTDTIMILIAAISPAVIAIICNIVSCFLQKKALKETAAIIVDTKEYEDLKAQLKIVHAENLELKRKLNQLLTKIDSVYRKEGE